MAEAGISIAQYPSPERRKAPWHRQLQLHLDLTDKYSLLLGHLGKVCADLATRACAGEPVVLLQALLPLLVANIQWKVALGDLFASRQVMQRPKLHLHGRSAFTYFCYFSSVDHEISALVPHIVKDKLRRPTDRHSRVKLQPVNTCHTDNTESE